MASRGFLENKAMQHVSPGEQILAVLHGRYAPKNTGYKAVMLATNQKVIFYTKMLLNEKFEVLPYAKISSIELQTSMIGFAKATLYTFNNDISMKNIRDGEKFVQVVREGIEKKEISAAPAAAATPAAPDIPDQIRKLAELKEAGILTEEEFAAKKQMLLAKM